jgi:hypothetical protein
MDGKHYIIATQTGYLVDNITGYPYEFATRKAAVKALAEEVKDAAQECRRRYKTCSVVGSARSGRVQINVGGRQGYNLWQRYVINERSGSRKPAKESKLLRELRAASKPVHATIKDEAAGVTYLTTPIAEVRNDPPPRGSGMTREGYTKRSGAPTAQMIRLQGEKRWRRLMVWQFSNLGTMFVNISGKPHVVREEMIPRETTGTGTGRQHATKKSPAQLDREITAALAPFEGMKVVVTKTGAQRHGVRPGLTGTIKRVASPDARSGTPTSRARVLVSVHGTEFSTNWPTDALKVA